jgi:hypothetical protein
MGGTGGRPCATAAAGRCSSSVEGENSSSRSRQKADALVKLAKLLKLVASWGHMVPPAARVRSCAAVKDNEGVFFILESFYTVVLQI